MRAGVREGSGSAVPSKSRLARFTLYERLAELLLLYNRCWIGTGKNLPRRLRELDPQVATALGSPPVAGDHAAFGQRAAYELERLGGRVQAGFVR